MIIHVTPVTPTPNITCITILTTRENTTTDSCCRNLIQLEVSFAVRTTISVNKVTKMLFIYKYYIIKAYLAIS